DMLANYYNPGQTALNHQYQGQTLSEIIAESDVDILAWQDSTGTGTNTNNQYTYDPNVRIPLLSGLYAKLRKLIDDANGLASNRKKALWSVTETWQIDGTCPLRADHYCGGFPQTFDTVSRAMTLEVPYVDAISIYEFASSFASPR